VTSPAISSPLPSLRRLRVATLVVVGWTAVALLLSVQGYVTAASAGRPQPWWPSFGYSLAIFSIWAVLTAPILSAVRRVEASGWSLARRVAVYAAGGAIAWLLHIGLFVLAFWPVYNDGGRIATPWAMAELMFVRNLGTDLMFYAALVAVGLVTVRRAVRAPQPMPEALRARSRGAVRIVPLAEVDWIGAAGNYAEAHTAAGPVLLDESLASLAARLPADRFARIHRGAIVRLDRIAEIRSLGRGDAEVVLRSGAALRLSRRYRSGLSAWLSGR